jgi:PBP1b-binding outer membrane lipoprotein LpoB
MKKFNTYFMLILAAAFLSSCSGLNKMKKNEGLIKYDVTPKVLETHAGLVKGSSRLSISTKRQRLPLLRF